MILTSSSNRTGGFADDVMDERALHPLRHRICFDDLRIAVAFLRLVGGVYGHRDSPGCVHEWVGKACHRIHSKHRQEDKRLSSQDVLLAEAEQLADMLMQCQEVQEYRRTEASMNALPEVAALLRRLRDLQEQIGEFVSRNVPEEHFRSLQEDMDAALTKLEGIPEVTAFMAAQTRINDLIQAVTGRLASALQPPDTEPS